MKVDLGGPDGVTVLFKHFTTTQQEISYLFIETMVREMEKNMTFTLIISFFCELYVVKS